MEGKVVVFDIVVSRLCGFEGIVVFLFIFRCFYRWVSLCFI